MKVKKKIRKAYLDVFGEEYPTDAPPPPSYKELLAGIELISSRVRTLITYEDGKPINCSQETYKLADTIFRDVCHTLNPGVYDGT